MIEQYAHRDVGRGREAAGNPRRQHLEVGRRGRCRPRSASCRTTTATNVFATLPARNRSARRIRTSGATRPRPADAGKAAEPRAPYVQDRRRSGRAGSRSAARALAAADARTRGRSAGATEPPATRHVPRRAQARSVRSGNRAGGAHQQRPAVDPAAQVAPSANERELNVRHTLVLPPRGRAPTACLGQKKCVMATLDGRAPQRHHRDVEPSWRNRAPRPADLLHAEESGCPDVKLGMRGE